MHFDDFDLDSVLADYDKFSKESGLDKKSTYTLPVEQVTHSDGPAELPFYEDLYKMAAQELSNEQLLDQAHPEGSKKLEGIDASDDLAVVEDLKGNQKRIMDMATKEVKIAEVVHQLSSLASELDDAKLFTYADKVDKIASFLVKSQSKDELWVKASQLASNLNRLLNAVFGEFEDNAQTKAALNSMKAKVSAIQNGLANLSVAEAQKAINRFTDSYEGFLNAFSPKDANAKVRADSLSKTIFTYIGRVSDLVMQVSNAPEVLPKEKVVEDRAKERDFNPEDLEILPIPEEKPKPKGHRGMLEVQKKVNQILELAEKVSGTKLERVSENGYQGDKKTWLVIRQIGFAPKIDFKNYTQLLKLLEGKLLELEMGAETASEKRTEFVDEDGINVGFDFNPVPTEKPEVV